jgi:predicted dehydrogenase
MRFGIIGCGGIANIHADALKNLEAKGLARLVAGGEIFAPAREKFARKWAIPMHDSLAGLLSRDDLDAVVVASISGLHAEQSIAIAKSGRHVLCEKPLDTRVEKAEAAIRAARENHVVLGGIFQQRFIPHLQQVKKIIDAGYFGQIVYAHCETPWYRGQAYYDQASWRGTWAMDGGVLSNQAPHMIDRMLWLAGDFEDVISATCLPGYLRKIEAETLAVATVKLKNGALATITGTTLAYEGMPQRVMVCGTEGSVSICEDEIVYFKTLRPADNPPAVARSQTVAAAAKASNPLDLASEYHLANMEDFIRAVRDGRKPAVSDEESLRVVKLLNRIYEKAGVGPYAKK